MTFDFAQLFERRRLPGDYRNEAAYFAAIKSRAKGLDESSHRTTAVTDSTTYLENLVADGLDHGLAVALVPDPQTDPRCEDLRSFVLHLDQLWRVPALMTMSGVRYGERASWAAMDALESILRGYTETQRATWNAHRPPTGHGRQIYLLLTAAQRRAVESTGRRSFGPAGAVVRGATVFCDGDFKVLRPHAATLIPRGRTLARVIVELELLRALFEPGAWHGSAVVPSRLAARFNAGLSSTIELYGANGWES